ncbi:MAG: hypothetical protein IJ594_01085 [Oscillospiraceae bacterium]|nr:hypothetical protein [Oscillospiraceae bacterium]
MKKKIFSLFLILVLLGSLSVCAFADGKTGTVVFNKSGKMESDFTSSEIAQWLSNMEPGDTATFSVTLTNSNAKSTNWYMSNSIVKTLEKGSAAAGGAYSYRLTYTGSDGSVREFYNSETVGGDNGTPEGNGERVGLEEATTGLEDFFFLGTLGTGKSGVVRLTVGLDGETITNNYQITNGEIVMNFAAEYTTTSSGTQTQPVKTGDENDLTPYYIIMVVSGLLFLYLALDAITDRIYGGKRG